jgi:hypothetical protein
MSVQEIKNQNRLSAKEGDLIGLFANENDRKGFRLLVAKGI